MRSLNLDSVLRLGWPTVQACKEFFMTRRRMYSYMACMIDPDSWLITTMANLGILRTYALKDPASLPPSVLFHHSAKSLTLFDAFPKSIFHFLVLPRVTESSLTVSELASLKSLLKCDKDKAKKVILALKEDAAALKQDIEAEMMQVYGFKWGIWTGFHAAPSMEWVLP